MDVLLDGASDQNCTPFAVGETGDDPDDEMKGIGLTALWPALMSSKELFSLLTRPKDRHLHGVYSSFLYSLAPTLGINDLSAALDWFTAQGQRDMGPIDSVMDDIIRLAVKNTEAPGVLDGLVKAILSRVKLHDRLMSGYDHGDLMKELRSDHKHRQMLLRELLPRISETTLLWSNLISRNFLSV